MIFGIGFVFGLIILLAIVGNTTPSQLDNILLPFAIIGPIFKILLMPLDFFCAHTNYMIGNREACAGLGFDGGPLEWIEFTLLYISTGLYYGSVFLFISEFYRIIRGKFAKMHSA
jgi:hypothetical protein